MTFEVKLDPAGIAFEALPDRPLLQSAEAAGIALPSSCRNGTCRTCIVQSTEGTVRYDIEWPGVSAEEKKEGWILPCVARPTSNLTLCVEWVPRFDL
ncbi:2Fe-2S iron-sulfur cluster-binding protein [Variovorax sp. VNK109]|jgi:ferredoxin|uniref:2Fe-2S iron-sulfur cluster-binding protein n=1 Tax=Variovorax sp. VNK109 TaxID=3400919 RepID=UPI003C0AF444